MDMADYLNEVYPGVKGAGNRAQACQPLSLGLCLVSRGVTKKQDSFFTPCVVDDDGGLHDL